MPDATFDELMVDDVTARNGPMVHDSDAMA